MQNEYLNEYTPAESIKQISQFFDIIDQSVQVGDTNRKYSPSKNAASPGGSQKENQYITFNISPVGENICDLYNSVIGATMTTTIKPTATTTAFPSAILTNCNAPAVWIGFIDSLDSVASYQIFANGRQIYTQDMAHNESFITGCGTTEAIKTVDIFSKARHKDVWKRADTVKSGFIIDFAAATSSASEFTCTIPIKIDLRRFLVLDAIRYLPAFAGNLQIKIRFSSEALQVAPLSIEDCLQTSWNINKLASYPAITNKFTPLGSAFTMVTSVTTTPSASGTALSAVTAITPTTGEQTLAKSTCEISDTYSYLNSFSIDANSYSELVERYSSTALSFPIKRMDWMTMEGTLYNTSGAKSVFTTTYTPLYVNSIYVLFKRDANYHTNYDNPLFTNYQLNMGAYGNIPSEPESSNGPIFYETCANAMNTNNDLCGFNTDVMRSLTATSIQSTGYKSNDTTHFFMGFPTETDFTFQQGQTSNSPISYKLSTTSSENTVGFNEKPEIGFLRHCCFSIQIKPAGPPVVTIDDYDLSMPFVEPN